MKNTHIHTKIIQLQKFHRFNGSMKKKKINEVTKYIELFNI